MRLGFFGGSFDPVHNGHLELARTCQRHATLDEVWFTPAAVQPLKHHGPHAPDPDRLVMLAVAIASELGSAPPTSYELYLDAHEAIEAFDKSGGLPPQSEPGGSPPRFCWRICSLEVNRGGVSYTVDTLRAIHAERPNDELFILLGADTLRDVPQWREPAEICRLATPLVVRRAGQPEPDLSALASLTAGQVVPLQIEMPAMTVSSTDVRRRIAAGQSIDDLVPTAVAEYIVKNGLYL